MPVDARLGRLTRAGGAALAAAGCVVVATLPLPLPARALLAVAWIGAAGRDLLAWRHSERTLVALSLAADGSLAGLFRNGIWRDLEPLPGAVVTARFAWLGGRDRDGRCYRSWCSARAAGGADWRRFQVLWRLTPRFGRSW